MHRTIRSLSVLVAAAVLLAGPTSSERDAVGKRVFTSHPSAPSQLYINEAVGDTRVVTLPGKNKLYELLLYPTKLTRKPLKAVVMLSGDIAGTLYLTQQKPPLGPVDIDGFVQDSETSLRVVFGQYGDLGAGCSLQNLNQFNPYGKSHGRHGDPSRSLGDLGYTAVASNHFRLLDSAVSLTGTRSVLGRLALVQDRQSGRTGCGVVGYASGGV
ncbi:Superoxide dismutase [Cu-Zn] B [Amphibalanus amphitrite]|uniref:Superoxide dismutase [Cu-Zn] B n=1 Tax=Amphibalanus amphitrite TaxID=1232801 RepID=A0A6A4WWL5_AMPAM|nr:Superoxide dismutase [Cu-Zn] B [Amphibalanus amphitrite]KAF0311896.1 Superoxide dismutase [Cu-Zn] B [Amphibalanus amphitrite]